MTALPAKYRNALLKQLQSLPDGAVLRVTAVTETSTGFSEYVTVGPLSTTVNGYRYVGETCVLIGSHVTSHLRRIDVVGDMDDYRTRAFGVQGAAHQAAVDAGMVVDAK